MSAIWKNVHDTCGETFNVTMIRDVPRDRSGFGIPLRFRQVILSRYKNAAPDVGARVVGGLYRLL